ncbi:MAG: ZIP family metal transporter [Candidatus Diapherotrites archaeon]|nr:ZIP family metal transporter [Candidatus Diapherotrites archaeon]
MADLISIIMITIAAGLAMGAGGFLIFFRKPTKLEDSFLMSLSSGILIALAFSELLSKSLEGGGFLLATLGFALGVFLMLSVDTYFPHLSHGERRATKRRKIPGSMGLLFSGLLIHAMPLGFSISAGYLHSVEFGFFVAIAVTLHNIPKGFAFVSPMAVSEITKTKALTVSFLNGLILPLGAIVASLLFSWIPSAASFALSFSAGILLFIGISELVHASQQIKDKHSIISMGVSAGVIVLLALSGTFF